MRVTHAEKKQKEQDRECALKHHLKEQLPKEQDQERRRQKHRAAFVASLDHRQHSLERTAPDGEYRKRKNLAVYEGGRLAWVPIVPQAAFRVMGGVEALDPGRWGRRGIHGAEEVVDVAFKAKELCYAHRRYDKATEVAISKASRY